LYRRVVRRRSHSVTVVDAFGLLNATAQRCDGDASGADCQNWPSGGGPRIGQRRSALCFSKRVRRPSDRKRQQPSPTTSHPAEPAIRALAFFALRPSVFLGPRLTLSPASLASSIASPSTTPTRPSSSSPAPS